MTKSPSERKPVQKQPLESFDPRMMQLLIRGVRERIVIPFIGEGMKAKCHLFQRRLHTLRARMRQANHEHAITVTRVVTRMFWGEKAVFEKLAPVEWLNDRHGTLGAYLIIEPNDAKFEDILSKLDVEQPPPSLIAPMPELNIDDVLSIIDDEGSKV